MWENVCLKKKYDAFLFLYYLADIVTVIYQAELIIETGDVPFCLNSRENVSTKQWICNQKQKKLNSH